MFKNKGNNQYLNWSGDSYRENMEINSSNRKNALINNSQHLSGNDLVSQSSSGISNSNSKENLQNGQIKESFQLCDSETNELLYAIENILINMLSCELSGETPFIEIPRYNKWEYSTFNGRLSRSVVDGQKTSKIKSSSSRFKLFEFVLTKIYTLLQRKESCTKREIYYENRGLFKSQSDLNRVINDICCLFSTPSWKLGILSSSKGIIAGDLIFDTSTLHVNVTDRLTQPVPCDISTLKNIRSNAKFILVVEKDTVFQKLIADHATKILGPCIIITAKGYPDTNTRFLLKRLSVTLNIPVLFLADCDVYGIEIMCVYKYGSLAMSFDSDHLAVTSTKWIGVYPSEIELLHLNNTDPLNDRDKRKINCMLKREYVQADKIVEGELECLRRLNVKAEIEALYALAPEYLTRRYLKDKVERIVGY